MELVNTGAGTVGIALQSGGYIELEPGVSRAIKVLPGMVRYYRQLEPMKIMLRAVKTEAPKGKQAPAVEEQSPAVVVGEQQTQPLKYTDLIKMPLVDLARMVDERGATVPEDAKKHDIVKAILATEG